MVRKERQHSEKPLDVYRSFLRSSLTSGTVLGLTANANKEMRDRQVKYLGMKSNLCPIVVSPNKDNISFIVTKVENKIALLQLDHQTFGREKRGCTIYNYFLQDC